jgi:hypothetical protein
MAKPINPYQGPAPAAMAQMGAGILEAGARIGQTIQGGYESMGKGIASGISSVAGAYKEYKDDQAKFDATKKMYKAFGGSLDENTRKEADTIFADTSMSVREKNALAPTLMQYLGASQQQKQALEKQKAELDARAGLQAAGDVAARDRAVLSGQTQLDVEQLRQKYRAQQSGGVNFGLDPFSVGGPSGGAASYNQQYGN